MARSVTTDSADGRTGWYGVRCVIRWSDGGDPLYEESITVWRAVSFEEAIVKAEDAARDYAQIADGRYLDFAQAYFIGESIEEGAEVFSLMRASALAPEHYLTRHFDTGRERQGHVGEDGPPLGR